MNAKKRQISAHFGGGLEICGQKSFFFSTWRVFLQGHRLLIFTLSILKSNIATLYIMEAASTISASISARQRQELCHSSSWHSVTAAAGTSSLQQNALCHGSSWHFITAAAGTSCKGSSGHFLSRQQQALLVTTAAGTLSKQQETLRHGRSRPLVIAATCTLGSSRHCIRAAAGTLVHGSGRHFVTAAAGILSRHSKASVTAAADPLS